MTIPRFSIKKSLLFGFYLSILLLTIPETISWVNRGIFILYGIFVYWIVTSLIKKIHKTASEADIPERQHNHIGWNILLGFAILFFLASRIFLFLKWGPTPLGYDTGFYWQYFAVTTTNGTLGTIISTNHIVYAPWFPLFFAGLSGLQTINFLHVFYQLLTLGAFYFFIRSLPLGKYTRHVSIAGIFLFAVSINQFMMFWWMLYKQSMAIPFLFLALGLFIRRSWWAIPIMAFGASIHAYPAISFIITLVIFIMYQITASLITKKPIDKDVWYLTGISILTGIAVLLLKGTTDIVSHLSFLSRFHGLSTAGQSWEATQAKGSFLPFSTFRVNTLFYIPFSIIGIITTPTWLFPRFKDRSMVLPILFFILLILGAFPFLYQNRSLPMLDIMMIVLAAYPLAIFMDHFSDDRYGQFILAMLLLGSVVFTSRILWNTQPQIYPDEAAELEALRMDAPNPIRKAEDYAMATDSIYTPWVYAYTNFQPTIVPGWLTWNKWSLPMWREFWSGNSDTRRIELLRMYGDHKIFIFIGSRKKADTQLQKFLTTNSHIKNISPHVWEYLP